MILKLNLPNDVYKSIYVASTYYTKTYSEKNIPQKHCKGLTQSESVPLWTTLIYTALNLQKKSPKLVLLILLALLEGIKLTINWKNLSHLK